MRAERNGDFLLHLQSVSAAVPWFRAAGRNQYCKFVPTYVMEMKFLEREHSESFQHLCDGGFVVRKLTIIISIFNSVATDQALEQTINKEGKSKGGIIGFTLKKISFE